MLVKKLALVLSVATVLPVVTQARGETGGPAAERPHCGWLNAQSSALNYAVCQSDLATVAALVDVQHVDVNAKDANGQTPLDVAFNSSDVYWQSGFSPEMISFLLDRGANPNAIFADGGTALTAAAYFGELDVITLLASRGADVNLPNAAGHTPLRNAAVCDFRLSDDANAAATIAYLTGRGANAKAPTTEGANLLATVPAPCDYDASQCAADKINTVEWGTGYCKQTYLLVKKLVSN